MILNRRKLEIARAKAQLSYQNLCKQAHCNPRVFSGNGPIKVTVLAAGRIAAVLGVPLENLLEDE